MSRCGDTLQVARLNKNLTLEQVSRDTRIGLKYLVAIEEGENDLLPAAAYARAYVRTYAQYLGLDPVEMVNMFSSEWAQKEPEGPQSEAKISGVGRPITPFPFVVGLLVIAGILVIWFAIQQYGSMLATLDEQKDASTVTVPSVVPPTAVVLKPTATIPVSTPVPTAAPTARKQLTIEVRVIQRSWFAVSVDGTPTYTGTLEAGESKSWTANDKITMTSGNPNSVELLINGRYQGRLASPESTTMEYEWKVSQYQ